MTLNKDGLQHIGEQAIAAANQLQVNAPENTLVLPVSHELHDMQHLQPTKRRFTGTLATADLADFIAYTKDHHDTGAEGFIDADRLACTVFFNLGDESTPGHADWTAKLQLKATASYDALMSINGDRLDQMELTNWLEDWADCITPFARDEGSAYGTIGKAVQAIRQITMKATSENESKVGDFAATRTALEEIEAKSKLDLPGGFTFTCEPYTGLPIRTFRLRLQVLTSSKDPILVLRIVQLEAQREAIARDFKGLLNGELDGYASLTIGTFTP